MTIRFRAALAVALALTVSACDSSPGPNTDQELITRVQIRLTNVANSTDTATITFTDLDGEGGDPPVFSPSTLTLRRGTTYDGTITLDDTIGNTSITDEIQAAADAHLFRYALTPGGSGTVTLTDQESDYRTGGRDLPVGLTFRVVVSGAASGNGTLHAILYHFDAAAKTSGTATSDEIDVDIRFPVTYAVP